MHLRTEGSMNIPHHSWEDLRLVLAIAQGHGLSGASRLLGLHHATILRRLNSFEHRNGVVLFNRAARGYEPTHLGEELAHMASIIEQDVEEAYRRLAGQDLRLSGTIRFATSDYIAQTLLSAMLSNFRKQHPSIEIEVAISPQFASLTKRDADVAIRATNERIESLTGKRISFIRYGIYGHKSLLEEEGNLGLEQLDWVGVDHTLAHVSTNQWRLSAYPNAQVRTRFDSLIGIFNAISVGMGVGFLPHFMANRDKDLICLASGDETWKLDLWLLVHPDLRHMNRIKVFMQSAERLLNEYNLAEIDEHSPPLSL